MIINHNLAAMNSFRLFQQNNAMGANSAKKLSSGLRINSAADDAAGLAISEKMRAQIRGLKQSSRNIQDAISLVQTAEGAMQEVHALLQRGRELSVQAANDTYTHSDKLNIQKEINQIIEEVDRIASTTEFNTKKLLNNKDENKVVNAELTDEEKVLKSLLRSAFEQSEKIIEQYLGLKANGESLTIKFEYGQQGGTLAYVTANYTPNTGGPGQDITLTIDINDFLPAGWPNDYDRIIAREMTKAVMAATLNWGETSDGKRAIPEWFIEGVAEFIIGGKERLAETLSYANPWDIAYLMEYDGYGWFSPGTSDENLKNSYYSMAYASVRFLHTHIKNTSGSGIKDIIDYLKADPYTATLDEALKNMPYGSFSSGLSGYAFYFMNVGINVFYSYATKPGDDVGAIGGADVDGGPVKTKEDVIPDIDHLTDDPLMYWNEIWPSSVDINKIFGFSKSENLTVFQLGANQQQTMGMKLPNVDRAALGIQDIDVVVDAENSITIFDQAIEKISSERSSLGAIQNRLEYALAMNNNYQENLASSESRIRDADMAEEIMTYTKYQVLSQVSQSMLIQANQRPQMVLQLLG